MRSIKAVFILNNLHSVDSDFADSMTTQAQQEQILRPIPYFTIVTKPLHCALNWSEDTVDRLSEGAGVAER